jgi:hypothetical protein
VLFSSISSDHATLEGNENKSIINSNKVNQNTAINRSSQSQTNEEVNVNKAKNNRSHQQFVDYNVESDFTHRKASSRADQNSKRLILDNYLSSELQTDTVISKDALSKYRVSSAKRDQQSENVLKSFNEEPKKMTKWRFNDDEGNTQHKNISSVIDDYFIRNDSPSVEQNKIHTNLYGAKRRHFKQNYHMEDFAITETENKNGILNAEKYDKQIALNADISQNNTQFSSSEENPMKVTSFEGNKQLGKKTATNTSQMNQMKQLITSTTKNSSPMNIQEMDNQSTRQDVEDTEKNENLPQNDVYIEANQIFDPATGEDKVQPLQESLINRKSYEHRPPIYVNDFSETSDHSFNILPKDSANLDHGLEMGSNTLVIKNIQPRQVSQDILKFAALQQPGVGEPQADPELDLFKKEFERAEKLSRGFERLIQFVNIVAQVDSYLTDKARSAIRKLARIYDGDNDQGYYRCA